jgi:hypothetical protein
MNNDGLRNQVNFKIVGHDNRAEIELRDGVVYRSIYADHIAETEEVLSKCALNSDTTKLLVSTGVYSKSQEKLILKHELLATSYPYEWTPAMLIDAALHTLDLSDSLRRDRLVVKDFLPSNLLYDGKQWKFIDFCSIIREESLLSESWLPRNETIEKSKRSIFKIMFIPFFFVPILLGVNGATYQMANLLKDNYCNSGKWAPGWRNLLFSRISKKYFSNLICLLKAHKIIRKSDIDQMNNEIRNLLMVLRRKSPKSAYSNYYEQKNEDSSVLEKSDWNDKQKSIDRILDAKRPKTLVDIGANTGWYSMLGLKYGATVYALDNDCASLDIAYRKTIKNGLIPFHIDFEDIWKQANQVSISFNERFRVDMVFALGLVHHLVLGKGLSIELVMQRLSSLATESLVIEFVDLEDEKIVNEPTFFGSFKTMSSSYSEGNFIEEGLRYFSSVETLPSSPSTRRILIFSR